MGRASNRKRLRRQPIRLAQLDSHYEAPHQVPAVSRDVNNRRENIRAHLAQWHASPSEAPGVVYRYFADPAHADALSNGRVWLSTLEACRSHETPGQGDADEALQVFDTGVITGGSEDDAFRLIASRAGIGIGPNCSNVTISNCRGIHRIPDAYVICATESADEDLTATFGHHRVRIGNLRRFFELVTEALHATAEIRWCGYRRVIYRDRCYTGLQDPPGPIGFVKPADPYGAQQEVRLMWRLDDGIALTPFELHVPGVARLCRRQL